MSRLSEASIADNSFAAFRLVSFIFSISCPGDYITFTHAAGQRLARADNAAIVFNLMRHLSLNLLSQEKSSKGGIKS
jgi:hypothetical protein